MRAGRPGLPRFPARARWGRFEVVAVPSGRGGPRDRRREFSQATRTGPRWRSSETARSKTGDPGIDEYRGTRGAATGPLRGVSVPRDPHRSGRIVPGEGHTRHVRSAQIQRQAHQIAAADIGLPQPDAQAQRGSGVRRPAADPRGDRQLLLEMQRRRGRDTAMLGQCPRCLQDQIIRATAERGGKRAGDAQAQIARRSGGQPVADIGEGDQAVEFAIPAPPPAGDMEPQVDLGRRKRLKRRIG